MVSSNYQNVGIEIEYQLVKFYKIEVVLVKLDVLGIIGRFNFEKLAPGRKAPILGIGPIGYTV